MVSWVVFAVLAVSATASHLPLTAEPVWAGASKARYALLRREVILPQHVSDATILVSAAQSGPMEKLLGAYRLYVGGVAVGIGPGRGDVRTAAYSDGGDANHSFVDVHRVTNMLPQSGPLALGLQCYHASGDSSAGVILELRLTLPDGSKTTVGTSSTDGHWLTLDATAAFNPTDFTSSQYDAPQEWQLSGLMPRGWTAAGFIAAQPTWQPPASRKGTVPSLAAESLRLKPTLPLVLTSGVRPTAVRKFNATAYFLDFGHELMGGLTLLLPATTFPIGSKVRVTLGEELMGDPSTSTTILYPMRTGNKYRCEWTVTAPSAAVGADGSGDALFEHHEYMEFRYAELVVVSSGRSVDEDAASLPASLDVSAWTVGYSWREVDSAFTSSDATLDAVWRLSRDTLRWTSLDTATDSNTRERLPYEADGYITGLSRLALQAEYAWPRHSWRHNLLNPTWPTEWRQTAPLMAHADFLATGELDLFEAFGGGSRSGVLATQTQAGCINASTGLVDFRRCARQTAGLGAGPEAKLRDIVDWPQPSRDGYVLTDAANTVVNAFAVGGLRALSSLSSASGDAAAASALAATADGLAAAVNRLLWDNTSGLYRDGLDASGAPINHTAWHASVFAAAFGLVPAERWPTLLAFFRTRGMVGSVYAAFYFLRALYVAPGDHGQLALEMLTSCAKNSWCAMLRAGATATMEAWSTDEKPNLSWSHPWASAPASAVVWGLFGMRPTAPAWGALEVRPKPGNLTWATIRVPSPQGPIDASFNQTKAYFGLTLSVPSGVRAMACLPRLGLPGNEVRVDGKPTAGWLDDDGYVCVAVPASSSGPARVERGGSGGGVRTAGGSTTAAAAITRLRVMLTRVSHVGSCPDGLTQVGPLPTTVPAPTLAGSGWDNDFNDGASGQYAYLCYSREPGTPIGALLAFRTPSSAQPLGDCPAGYTKVQGVDGSFGSNDLNAGSHNDGAAFLCYENSTVESPSSAVVDIAGVAGAANASHCAAAGWEAVGGPPTAPGVFDFDPAGVGLTLCVRRASTRI